MKSEACVQQEIRLASANDGFMLWRNNSGACKDLTGRLIRYGLGNDSTKINAVMKSSDLIGVTNEGIFMAIEVKAEGWSFQGNEREVAQLNFINKVTAMGGIAGFCTSVGDYRDLIEARRK